MRPLLAVLLSITLAACPAPKPTAPAAASPTPAPGAPPETAAPAVTPSPAAGPDAEYVGVWTTVDEQGQLFDITIFPNGQAVTTWTKGKDGAMGERGFWRKINGGIVAIFDDGWSDKILTTSEGVRHQGFAAGLSLDGNPTNSAPIDRVAAPLAEYVGVWRLNKEPDGSHQYVTLQSNGRALSTVNGGTEGQWTATEKGAECKWPDGWVDLIERTDQGWQKRSFVGTSEEAQADLSPAIRMGDARFMATAP